MFSLTGFRDTWEGSVVPTSRVPVGMRVNSTILLTGSPWGKHSGTKWKKLNIKHVKNLVLVSVLTET